MSDVNGAAPAAAEPISAPEAHEPVNTPAPIDSQGPQPDPKPEPEPKKPASIAESLKKADAKLKADPKDPVREKAEARPDPKADKGEPKDTKAEPVESKGPNRGEDGKFAPKEPKPAEAKAPEAAKDTPWRETPKRFSEDARREWDKTPDSVKAESHRAIRELEDGLKEYQKRWEPLKDYDSKAREYNTSIKDALDRYTGLESKLTSGDPHEKLAGLQQVFDYANINMREFAARLIGQQPDQTAVHYEGQMQSLRNQISDLQGRLQAYESKEQEATMNTVEQFAAAHPRFDELSTTIAKFLETGFASNLDEAYAMADRLKPGAVEAKSDPAQPEAAPQPRAQKSIAGAPTAGSSPAKGKPSNSIMEALKRAQARASV